MSGAMVVGDADLGSPDRAVGHGNVKQTVENALQPQCPQFGFGRPPG